jgi:hypothetical protein
MTATVDFGARTVDFRTTGTTIGNLSTGGSPISRPGLDLRGNLGYAAGTNQFTGGVSTADTSLNGSATGRFYGPAAQEIGGVYSLTGAGQSSLIGGFGGKRP